MYQKSLIHYEGIVYFWDSFIGIPLLQEKEKFQANSHIGMELKMDLKFSWYQIVYKGLNFPGFRYHIIHLFSNEFSYASKVPHIL
jgi:hypothetical protein